MKRTDILDVISRKLAPYIFLFGFYLVTFGHVSPGGGFQGGVVIASGVILLAMGQGVVKVEHFFPYRTLSAVEAVSYFLLVAAGIGGVVAGAGFLGDFLIGDAAAAEAGTSGATPVPGFILLLNVLIGIKVAAGVSLICVHLLAEEES